MYSAVCHDDNYSIMALPVNKKIQKIAQAVSILPQAECPIIHHFGPGLYIREVSVKAGTLAVGHYQKFEHLNILLKGKVTIVKDGGERVELTAPMIFVAPPGSKVGYVHEDMVWLNIYSTNETDVNTLESTLLATASWWDNKIQISREEAHFARQDDRDDYLDCLKEFGYSEPQARAQAEDLSVMSDLPFSGYKVIVRPSSIEGSGLIATANIDLGEVIAPALLAGKKTIAGRYTNHAKQPNAKCVWLPNGDCNLVAIRKISGNRAGIDGEEITVDYREPLSKSLLETTI